MNKIAPIAGVAAVAGLAAILIFSPSAQSQTPFAPLHTLSGLHAAAVANVQNGSTTVADVMADDGSRVTLLRSYDGGWARSIADDAGSVWIHFAPDGGGLIIDLPDASITIQLDGGLGL